jgi:hypothetical protein
MPGVGLPGIFIWISYYRRQFNRTGRPLDAAVVIQGRANPAAG